MRVVVIRDYHKEMKCRVKHDVCDGSNEMTTNDMPLLITESVYIPVLLSIQICLCFEVISLWLAEVIMALAFRLMIGGIIRATYYIRSHSKYTNELSQLLWLVLIQDTFVMMITQGIYNPYTWFAVHLPAGLVIFTIHYRGRPKEKQQQQSPV